MFAIKINNQYFNGRYGATKDGKHLRFKTTPAEENAQLYGEYAAALEVVDWMKANIEDVMTAIRIIPINWNLPAKEQVANEKQVDMSEVFPDESKRLAWLEGHEYIIPKKVAMFPLGGYTPPPEAPTPEPELFANFCKTIDKHSTHYSCLSGLLYELEENKSRFTESHYGFMYDRINELIEEIKYKNIQNNIE